MYSVVGGAAYMAADALGKSIEETRQAHHNTPGRSAPGMLDSLPEWFPVRKLSAAEAEEKQRILREKEEREAEESRRRWSQQ